MGRYANALLRREYPDLSEDDDLIFVTIRNPKTVPVERLQPADLPLKEDGTPDMSQALPATYVVLAGLVVDWHVYDANDDADDSPALGLPATPAMIATLPMEILKDLGDQIEAVLRPPQ